MANVMIKAFGVSSRRDDRGGPRLR
jgi:hypothetical protein